MEFTRGDLENIIKPVYVVLESIDKRLETLEQTQRELSNDMKNAAIDKTELAGRINLIESDFNGFSKRYDEQQKITAKAVEKNYGDMMLALQTCKENCPLVRKAEGKKELKDNIDLWKTIGGAVLGLIAVVIVVTLWLNQNKLITLEDNLIKLQTKTAQTNQ